MNKITITLEKEQWIVIAKFLVKKCGEMVDVAPAIWLFQKLMDAGIKSEELK